MQKSPYRRENKLLAAILKELRVNVGMTQVDLAKLAELRQSDVSKVESGVRQISYLELRRWLVAVDFDMATFDAEFDARMQRSGLARPLRPS